ncbi:hypothetical protein A5712_15355 [Mycobacterium sp. E2327]|uniref:hypothetical protein n=1 Tax=Mycobacterium sp. E2327 TaxID=1834132 RepID=UPI00080104D7|nr:hypothetical protein [Mycobacterium sp. E2327]OBI21397.1 hypothetical protein A5712_15355 [Mycobacterium sp. E2327]
MDPLTKSRIQMFGVWCGIAYLATVFIGFGAFAGFIPPTAPSADAGHIAALYLSDHTRIRIGMLVLMLAALIFIPFAAVLSQFIARIEGSAGVLAYTFLLGAAGNMVLTFYPAIWWLTAAFRPDRGAELVYLMNDTAWLQLVGGVTVFLAMPLSVMVVALSDKSAEPVFPRWCGYANGWISLTILPDQLLFFFHRGPFAWNGLFAFWIPIAAFGGFFIVNFVVVRQAIRRERASILDSAEFPTVHNR